MYTIRENEGHRLSFRMKDCLSPAGLKHLEFVSESLTKGEVVGSSSYQFFVEKENLNEFCLHLFETLRQK
jgi:hypothetical protein